MRRIFGYLRPVLGRMAGGLAIKFTGTMMDLAIPWILAYLIDEVALRGRVDQILLWGGVMIACSIVAVAGNFIANKMASKVARDAMERIRHDLFRRVSYLSCGQIDSYSVPSLVSRLTSDTYNVHQMISMMQRMGVRAPILTLGGIIVTLTLDPVLTLVLLGVLPVLALVVYTVSKRGIPRFTQVQRAVDRMVLSVRESASGIRVIKALSKVDYEKERFAAVNREVAEREKKANTAMAITNPLMNLLLNGGLALVVLVGAYRVNAGTTQPGRIISFLSYFTIILNSMLAITRMFMILSKGSASAQRIAEILDAPEDLPVQEPDVVDNGYHVSFDHVSFSYHRGERDLSDVSFHLKQGETLGIIGATGCGKSTVIQLLMRLYDVTEGEIRINGQRVDTIPPEILHTMFGIAFQNDVLFADTIGENIDFGRQLRQEQIRDAAAFAQAEEFVEAVSGGYGYELTSRGTNLSGGQKQRLLIARALAGAPEILILDDSSSALDYRTDARLRKALRRHFRNTTAIIVAQRISSIRHADHILMLEEGKVLGYGTHEELLESCESYREISENQMGGGKSA